MEILHATPSSIDDVASKSGPLSRTWPQLYKKRKRASSTISTISTQYRHGSTAPPIQKLPIPKTSKGSMGGSISPDNASTSTSSTQADLLASKSNYEWIASGRHAEIGLHFSTTMATGVMMRRATHRAAEQARRDRMKSAMVDLAEFLFDGEVTFGSGTSCFVVSRNETVAEGSEGGNGQSENGDKKGRNINKARIIEMALEKLRVQEKELNLLEKRICACECGNRAEVTN